MQNIVNPNATEKAKAMNTDKMKQYATIENGIICINPMTIGPVAEYALNSTEIIDVSLGSNNKVKKLFWFVNTLTD